MKKTKVLLVLFMVLTIISSLLIPVSAVPVGQTMLWPDFDAKTKEPIYLELPFLSELTVGENTGLSLEKGYYSITADESGFYLISGIGLFQISETVEGNSVKKCDYSNWIFEENGEIAYFTKGETYYLRVRTTMDYTSAIVKYLGALVSAVPERDSNFKSQFTVWEEGSTQGTLQNYPIALNFAGGEQYRLLMWSGTIDGLEPGMHHFKTDLCGQPIEFDFTLIDFAESVTDVILPEDFTTTAVIRYMGNDGLCYTFAELPKSIEVKFEDGSSYTAHAKNIEEAWKAEYRESFIIDNNSHYIDTGYDYDESGTVYFYVSLDGTEILRKEGEIIVSSAFDDIFDLTRKIFLDIHEIFKAVFNGDSLTNALKTALTNISNDIDSFFAARSYAIDHGYSFVPVKDLKLLLGK